MKEYHSDNGTAFTAQKFRQHLYDKGQTERFAATGSHHQNGRAERAIRTIMGMSRTMLLHSAIHWSEVADATLWPLSVRLATYLYNRVTTNDSGLSPHDLWTRTRYSFKDLHEIQVFGCPVYVLDKKLSDGKKIPRWKTRAERYMYVGRSERHAGSAPLVLNLRTGNISAQWNVVFDNWFTTVATSVEDLPDFMRTNGDICLNHMA